MAGETSTATSTATQTSDSNWLAGGVSGLLAGIPFGLMIHFVLGAMPAIGALYTMPGVVTGWVAHLIHSIIFGLVFVGIVERTSLRQYTTGYGQSALLGLAYGVALWIVFLWFVWPAWLNAVGFPQAPSLPFIQPKPLVGHLVYGLVLGIVFPALREQM